MKRITMSLGIAAFGVFGMACEKADSADIKTGGMHATFTAVADGTGTHARAVLRVGGAASNTFVKLSEGDKLSVTAGTESTALDEENFGDFYHYDADLQADAAGTEFIFAFERTAEEDTDAPESRATLPNAFTVSEPAANTQISRAAALTVTWSDSGTSDAMLVEVKGDCIIDYRKTVTGDPGTVVIPANDIKAHNGQEGQACEGTVSVSRSRNGTLDPAYEGGIVTATQQRSVTVRLDP